MAGTIQDAGHDFWQPHVAEATPADLQPTEGLEESCPRCGIEFLAGARFCHVCGASRQSTVTNQAVNWQSLQARDIVHRLGLSTAPLSALLAGIFCLTVAGFAGAFFAVQTGADWESLQYWRIDWLLAATAMFTAGTLLKQK